MSSSRDPERTGSPNSFYALSDDEEGEYNTVAHTTTTKGVKLLFCKSKVSLGPQIAPIINRFMCCQMADCPSIGLYPPHTFCEGQQTWLHSAFTTEDDPIFRPTIDFCFYEIGRNTKEGKRSRRPTAGMDPGTWPRGGKGYLREG